MMIVRPVIVQPLMREWDGELAEIKSEMEKRSAAKSAGAKTQAYNRARERKTKFLERLKSYRILDPACGSGNFLYLGLKALKDIEHRVNTECEDLGIARDFPATGPENMLGIEINPFAAELARVSVWIGEIQWMREHGFDASRNPILKALDTIECRDALVDEVGKKSAWPTTDVIVGNPPFLGSKWMLDRLGEQYTQRIRSCYSDGIDDTSDLVSYWFEKSREAITSKRCTRAGLVATQMIRSRANRRVMNSIANGVGIFNAWADEPWVVDGADVRVSIVCFGDNQMNSPQRDGVKTRKIYADLSAGQVDLTHACKLTENKDISVRGIERGGAFHVTGEIARAWLTLPANSNGQKNADVLKRFYTVRDLLGRDRDLWLIDFSGCSEADAAIYEKVFKHAEKEIKGSRSSNRESRTASQWWLFRRSGEHFSKYTRNLRRYIVTGLVTKHRFFCWQAGSNTLPDTRIVTIARDDDTSFGILSSSFHTTWTLNLCQYHGVGNDPVYTTGSCFETYPFPLGLTPDIPASDYVDNVHAQAIATAASRLNDLRENWLNPADLVKREPEVVPSYPDRILAVDDEAAKQLKKRTLTNLYNQRPAWLDNAHRDLDAAVAQAYGWTDWGTGGLSDDVVLERLFELNQQRCAADERQGKA